MVMIRLARTGAKNRPFYQVVASDKRAPRDSCFIERLGYYDPLASGATRFRLTMPRIDYWLERGARMSDRVVSLVREAQSRRQDEDGASASEPTTQQ